MMILQTFGAVPVEQKTNEISFTGFKKTGEAINGTISALTENNKPKLSTDGKQLYNIKYENNNIITDSVRTWFADNKITLDRNSTDLLDKWLSEQSKKRDNVDPGSAAMQAFYTFNPNSTNDQNAKAKETVEKIAGEKDDGFFKAV